MMNKFSKVCLFIGLLLSLSHVCFAGKKEDKLFKGINENNISAVEKYLDKGGNVNAIITKEILQNNWKKEIIEETALEYAIKKKHYEIAKLLINRGADVNKGNPLCFVIWNNDEITELLLEKGANIDYRYGSDYSGGGFTELILAASGTREHELRMNKIRKLVQYGADLNQQCDWGRTTLYQAAWYAQYEICKFLLDSGADVTIVDKNNMNPLMVLGINSHNAKGDIIEIATMLLEKGVNINAEDTAGMTALMHAIEDNCEPLALYLLENGADVTVSASSEKIYTRYSRFQVSTLVIAQESLMSSSFIEKLKKAIEKQSNK